MKYIKIRETTELREGSKKKIVVEGKRHSFDEYSKLILCGLKILVRIWAGSPL